LFSALEQRKFKPFNELEAKHIFQQLLSAIEYCHRNGVVHFDIKLDNIMIEPETHKITLIDFGLCDYITDENGGKFTKRGNTTKYNS
jgi:serine/threonine protein kinase